METNTVLRDGSTHLTGDETLTTLLVGPMIRPLWLHVLCPSDASNIGATHKLDVELEFCTAAASTTEVYNMNMAQMTAAGHYSIPFFTKEAYVQVKLNVTDDGGADLDLAHVKVWIAPSGRYTNAING